MRIMHFLVLIEEIVLVNDNVNNGTVPFVKHFRDIASGIRVYLESVYDEFGHTSSCKRIDVVFIRVHI